MADTIEKVEALELTEEQAAKKVCPFGEIINQM